MRKNPIIRILTIVLLIGISSLSYAQNRIAPGQKKSFEIDLKAGQFHDLIKGLSIKKGEVYKVESRSNSKLSGNQLSVHFWKDGRKDVFINLLVLDNTWNGLPLEYVFESKSDENNLVAGVYCGSGITPNNRKLTLTISNITNEYVSPKDYSYSKNLRNQNAKAKSKKNLALIPLDQFVVNPDNVMSSLRQEPRLSTAFGTSKVYNRASYIGGGYRYEWGRLEDENGNVNFSDVESYLAKYTNVHVRCKLRIAQFSGSSYDNVVVRKPANYTRYKNAIDKFMRSNGLSFHSDGRLMKNNKEVHTGYPYPYFWSQVTDGQYPVIVDDGQAFFNAYPNYNSDSFYKAFYRFQEKFAEWLEGNLCDSKGKEILVNGKPVKRKDTIEILQCGSLGCYGEGGVQERGVFAKDVKKMMRYVSMYPTLFPDIALSFPLAASYDRDKYGDDYLKQIWSVRNNCGLSGLFYDMVGQENFHMYFDYYTKNVSSILREVGFNDRRIEGEGGYAFKDLPDILNHAYNCHFSAVSLDDINPSTPLGVERYHIFRTLAGSHLYIHDVTLRGNTLRFSLENLGMAKVFSKYWAPYVIYRDAKGKELGRQKLSFRVQDIQPNSQSYNDYGIIKNTNYYQETITIPSGTKSIYFAIVDEVGIYENYWLQNYGRVSFGNESVINGTKTSHWGEYQIWTL